MIILNLADGSLSGIKYEVKTLPDTEPHIKLHLTDAIAGENVRIVCRISSPADLLLVLFAKNALDHAGVEEVDLYITYLLTARMDRQMQPGEPFSLKVLAGILNNAAFKTITVFDPHSDVTPALLDNCSVVGNEAFVRDAIADYSMRHPESDAPNFCLVSPDAGALKKIYKVAESLGGMEVIECIKNRDHATGKLTGFKVFAEDLRKRTCFIVDDICDSGGTITGVAGELKKLNAGHIVFIVSHGIFSKGFPLNNVDEIYCTNSYSTREPLKGQLSVFNISRYFS